jgi:hypothetical protein
MVETLFWPGGAQPITTEPMIEIVSDLSGPLVRLHPKTAGASIGYRLCAGGECNGDGVWRLYSAPFVATYGAMVEAKAVRYGFKESAIIRQRIAGPAGDSP